MLAGATRSSALPAIAQRWLQPTLRSGSFANAHLLHRPLSGRLSRSASSSQASGSTSLNFGARSRAFHSSPRSQDASKIDAASSIGWYEQTLSYFEPIVPYVHALPEYLHLQGPHGYALSIIAVTIALRALVTLPIHLNQRERTRRYAEIVKPEFDHLRGKDGLPRTMLRTARLTGKSQDEYQKLLDTELRKRFRELVKENKCHPIRTVVAPVLVTIPLLFFVSFSIRAGVVPPSPFWSEIIPWWSPPAELAEAFKASSQMLMDRGGMDVETLKHLSQPMGPSLGQADSTLYGPLALLALNWTNIELTSYTRRTNLDWDVSDTDREIAEQQKQKSGGKVDQMKKLERSATFRSTAISFVLRAWTIVLIPLSTYIPGAILIYWSTSAAFTLVQNLVFSVIDRSQRTMTLAHQETAASPPPTNGPKRDMVIKQSSTPRPRR